MVNHVKIRPFTHCIYGRYRGLQAGVEVWLPLVMSAFSALLAITILLASFYAMRYLRMRRLALGGDLATALLQPEVTS